MNFVTALVIGVLSPILLSLTPVVRVKITDVASGGLAYASIAFGACITGAVLALSISPVKQVEKWVSSYGAGSEHSDYSHLIFVFTWSAMVQLAVVVCCGLAYVFGGDYSLYPADARFSHKLLLGISSAIGGYAVLQLAVVVSTISQVGHVIIVGLRNSLDDK